MPLFCQLKQFHVLLLRKWNELKVSFIIKSELNFEATTSRFGEVWLIANLWSTYIHFFIDLVMFEFEVLVERSFWPIRPLAGINWTSIMSLNFIGSPPESFLPIIITFLSFLNLLPFLLQFVELSAELVALVDQFPHLRHQHNISKVEPTIFVIIVEIGICFWRGICWHIFPLIINSLISVKNNFKIVQA